MKIFKTHEKNFFLTNISFWWPLLCNKWRKTWLLHPDQQESITWDWMNWWIWFITFMTLGSILALIFVFQKKLFSYAMTYKLIKYTFVNKDKTFIFFYLILSIIWLLQLALLWTWWFITTSYTNHCFNLFLVSELSMICVSLLHYDFVSITSCTTYILSIL